MAEKRKHDLRYEKGVGYYKAREESASLVASIGPEGLITQKGEMRGG